MATAAATPVEDFIWQSREIIVAHWRHFLTLSVLFLLPFSFFTTVYAEVFPLIIHQSNAVADTKKIILLLIAYVVVATVFHLLAVGSIAYSIYQGFHGKAPKLISSLKSSFASFLPLLATVISSNLIVLGILLILGFSTFLLNQLLKFILPDLVIDYTSPPYSLALITIPYVIVMKLYLNWILAWIIVVVESTWGLAPLKRSRSLIKGLTNKSLSKGVKSDSLSITLVFFITHVKFSMIVKCAAFGLIYGEGESGMIWTMLLIVFTVVSLTCLTLLNIASMTVMYIQCKADHGERACEIEEKEFAGEYMSLPGDDDGKVPHLVSVANNNVG